MTEGTTKKNSRRLDVLDGLRGFAIILVFLNHIDSSFIAQAAPSFLKPFIHFLFTSGNLGVTFFFILSGFLMGYLYANPQPKEFIERRYARIFPPFIVMVCSMFIFRMYPSTSLWMRISLILSIAFLARLLWIHVIEKSHMGSRAISLFMCAQVAAAFWYGFIIMRKPPIWFDSLPFFLKEGSIFASNATLTLPLGNYIPMLDGVYWSLAPEMIFYLLYPYLFSGTVKSLQIKNKLFIILFCVSLFPFFLGLSLLFKHAQGLSMLFIEYFIYFCGGIAISHMIRHNETKNHPLWFRNLLNPVTFVLLLFLTYLLLAGSSGIPTILVRLLIVFPFGSIVYALIELETPLSRLFQKKIFLFLGTISYSMYISHTAIVDGMHLIFKPHTAFMNILFLVLTAIIFLGVSTALHFIIEKPYFQFKPPKNKYPIEHNQKKTPYLILLVLVLSIFFSTYTSEFNFFSQQKKYKDIIPAPVKISSDPFTFSFIAQEDNMGVILVHLTNEVGDSAQRTGESDPLKPQKFRMSMRELNSSGWYASQETAPAEIGNSSSYPFGFPPIADSKNKTYVIEMVIVNIDYRSTVLFNKDEYQLKTVHQIPKQNLLKNPLKMLAHIGDKLQTALSNPEALFTAICISPFFILLFLL